MFYFLHFSSLLLLVNNLTEFLRHFERRKWNVAFICFCLISIVYFFFFFSSSERGKKVECSIYLYIYIYNIYSIFISDKRGNQMSLKKKQKFKKHCRAVIYWSILPNSALQIWSLCHQNSMKSLGDLGFLLKENTELWAKACRVDSILS